MAEEHEGASVKEQLIEACRRNNVDLLIEIIGRYDDEDELARLLNETTTVMGNHLYHEAAAQGNYEIIDLLLDQPNFECDPISRREGDTPLHTAIRWINSEPPAQREFGAALVSMMLEAGSSTRVRNRGGLTPLQLVDPRNAQLKDLIEKHEYALLSAGDFVDSSSSAPAQKSGGSSKKEGGAPSGAPPPLPAGPPGAIPVLDDYDDDDAEFSGSDDEERAEWERRRKERKR